MERNKSYTTSGIFTNGDGFQWQFSKVCARMSDIILAPASLRLQWATYGCAGSRTVERRMVD